MSDVNIEKYKQRGFIKIKKHILTTYSVALEVRRMFLKIYFWSIALMAMRLG
jgi:hypothetical protein